MRNEEMGGNGKWCTQKWEHNFFLGGEVTESVSEKVVTALLEYIRRICKQLFQ